jgi:hypothetical protein
MVEIKTKKEEQVKKLGWKQKDKVLEKILLCYVLIVIAQKEFLVFAS